LVTIAPTFNRKQVDRLAAALAMSMNIVCLLIRPIFQLRKGYPRWFAAGFLANYLTALDYLDGRPDGYGDVGDLVLIAVRANEDAATEVVGLLC
jgi:hypothetical protein